MLPLPQNDLTGKDALPHGVAAASCCGFSRYHQHREHQQKPLKLPEDASSVNPNKPACPQPSLVLWSPAAVSCQAQLWTATVVWGSSKLCV